MSQSEIDWAWTRSQLRKGADPAVLKDELRRRRPDKANLAYYANRTVERAVQSLAREREKRRAAREREAGPSR